MSSEDSDYRMTADEDASSSSKSTGEVEEGSCGAGMVHEDKVLNREAKQFAKGQCLGLRGKS